MSYPPQPPGAGPSGSGNGKRRRQEEPDQASLIQTTFYMPPALAIKTASSGFQKYDSQGGIARHRAQMEFDRASSQMRAERQFRAIMEQENKRIRLAGGVAWPVMGDRGGQGPIGGSAGKQKEKEETLETPAGSSAIKPEDGKPLVPPPSPVSALDFIPPHDAIDMEENSPEAQRTIVIHPGSRFIRIGRATDSLPVSVRNCIYRKVKVVDGVKVPNGYGKRAVAVEESEMGLGTEDVAKVEPNQEQGDTTKPEQVNAEAGPSTTTTTDTTDSTGLSSAAVPATSSAPPTAVIPQQEETIPTPVTATTTSTETTIKGGEDAEELSEEEKERQEGLTEVIADARKALRDRMRYNKLRLPPGKADVPVNMVARFNANSVPVELPTLSDPHGVEWVMDYEAEKLFPSPDLHVPEDAPYELRYPLHGRTFNTDMYDPAYPEILLSDIHDILEHALGRLEPPVDPRKLRNFSAVLVVPDWIEKGYIETMGTMLLQTMGFKQLGILQESVCATFGAGLSTACIVDIGATRTSVTCVEDGLALQDSRQVLDFGGDDITRFYADLLKLSSFPYKELDLGSRLDWEMLDELKVRTCTLMDSYVTNNVHKFYIKRKDALTKEYTFQTYDQPVISSSCLFDPRAMDWREKDKVVMAPLRKIAFDEDALGGMEDDLPSLAMQNSVRRAAIPEVLPPADMPPSVVPSDPAQIEGGTATDFPTDQDQQAQQPIQQLPPPPPVMSMAEILRDSNRLTLEYAITESLFAVEAKALSLASAILVLGGTSLIEGLAPALQWRIDYMIERKTGLQGKSAILPPPRGMDPRTVAWRGGAVHSRLDSMNELWIKRGEWSDLRMRAYRARVG